MNSETNHFLTVIPVAVYGKSFVPCQQHKGLNTVQIQHKTRHDKNLHGEKLYPQMHTAE